MGNADKTEKKKLAISQKKGCVQPQIVGKMIMKRPEDKLHKFEDITEYYRMKVGDVENLEEKVSEISKAVNFGRTGNVVIDLPTKTMEMFIAEIAPKKSSQYHKHHVEALIYILEGKGYSEIQGKRVDWEKGDVLFIPVFCWHQHHNLSSKPARYLGVHVGKLLGYLGLDVTVEAGIHKTLEEVEDEIRSSRQHH